MLSSIVLMKLVRQYWYKSCYLVETWFNLFENSFKSSLSLFICFKAELWVDGEFSLLEVEDGLLDLLFLEVSGQTNLKSPT